MLEVARLIRRNCRKRRKHRKVILDQTKEVLFSEKHNEESQKKNSSKKVQNSTRLSIVVSVFSNWLHSSEQIPGNVGNF